MLSESGEEFICAPQKCLQFSCHPALDIVHLNTLRKVWEISEEIQIIKRNMVGPGAYRMHDFQGGRGASNVDLEAEWGRVLDFLQ